jgi:hypothetical protein
VRYRLFDYINDVLDMYQDKTSREMEKTDKIISPFKALLRSMDTKRGKYRGIYADVARELGKPQPVVYTNIAYTEALNHDKEVFLRIKSDRDARAENIEREILKAS